MMVCATQSIDEHKLALTRIERRRRPQCNSEQKDKCIREKDTSQVLNWQFYERLQQNNSFNVNSGEATPGCCASRKRFCRAHLKCQFGTCEPFVSQTSVTGVFFYFA